MKYLIIIFTFIGFNVFSQNTIDSYEYWVDQYQNVEQVAISPSSSFNLNTQIDLSSYNKGFHTFYLRFKDSQNKYSSVINHLFYSKSGSAKISAFEYWFDMDYNNKVFSNVSPTNSINLNQSFDCNSLSNGMHIVHIRFLSEGGDWSSVVSQFFNKKSDGNTEAINEIISYEYWFNDNYNLKISGNTSSSQNLNFISSLDCSALTNGIHRFHIRFKDNSGQWSSVLSQFINKKHNGTSTINLITAYRYWYDQNYNEINDVSLSNPQNPYELITNFDLTQINKGEHLLHIQFKDTSGLWSSVLTDTIYKNPLPIADFNVIATGNCDSTVLSLTNFSVDADSYFWDFGDGTNSNDSLPSKTYLLSGTYIISLTVTDINSGLDSTLTKTIVVNGNTTSIINELACNQYISPSGNYTWTNSGTYIDTLINSNGCDSIITINLTINNSSTSSLTETSCGSYIAADGQILNQSGSYNIVIPNSVGCDSLIILNLTVNNVNVSVSQGSNILTAISDGSIYQWVDCNNGMSSIIGETEQSYTVTQNGSYAVIVTYNQCSDTSICYSFNNVGIEDVQNNDILIYPNPTDGFLTIHTNFNYNYNLELLDENGRVLLKNIETPNLYNINLYDLSSGIYVLKIQSNDILIYRKVNKL